LFIGIAVVKNSALTRLSEDEDSREVGWSGGELDESIKGYVLGLEALDDMHSNIIYSDSTRDTDRVSETSKTDSDIGRYPSNIFETVFYEYLTAKRKSYFVRCKRIFGSLHEDTYMSREKNVFGNRAHAGDSYFLGCPPHSICF
jgi:hypothetical protein